MLPLVLPHVHKIQGAGLKESLDKKHVMRLYNTLAPTMNGSNWNSQRIK